MPMATQISMLSPGSSLYTDIQKQLSELTMRVTCLEHAQAVSKNANAENVQFPQGTFEHGFANIRKEMKDSFEKHSKDINDLKACAVKHASLHDHVQNLHKNIHEAEILIRYVHDSCTASTNTGSVSNSIRSDTNASLEGEMATKWCTRILCFGDSLTEGVCFSSGRITPYSSRLQQRFSSSTVVNGGVSGEKTSDMLGRLHTVLGAGCSSVSQATQAFDLVLILGGTNDLLRFQDRDTIVRNLRTLHAEAHRRSARTAVITLPCLRAPSPRDREQMDANRRWINASLREFAAQDPGRRLLIDLAAEMPQDDAHRELWDSDGVHFTQKGYHAMGDVIGRALCRFAPPTRGSWFE